MNAALPSLTLIRETFHKEIQILLRAEEKQIPLEYTATVFLQAWPNTSLGFGDPGMDMITEAYTTAIQERHTSCWGVFYGNRPAYIIKDPNSIFFDDLKQQSMRCCKEAGVYAKDKIAIGKNFWQNGNWEFIGFRIKKEVQGSEEKL